jgi:MOSC domain-containing protein YiiM
VSVRHLSTQEIEAGLDEIQHSPKDDGVLHLIVRRPRIDAREILEEAELDTTAGLVGDSWLQRKSSRTADGSPHPDMQLNVMNVRTIALLAQTHERWPLAGDQLFIDLDLSEHNLPAGTQLALGTAVIEVTSQPHTGCGKFMERFGADAMQCVNSPTGRSLRMRGLNAKVVRAGRIRAGDSVRKITCEES